MNAFAPALDAVFAAFGVAAVYTPPIPDAPGVDVVTVARREDQAAQFGGGRVLAAPGLFEVRAAELASPPVKGGTLDIGTDRWRVESTPEMLDPDRLVWTLRCIRLAP